MLKQLKSIKLFRIQLVETPGFGSPNLVVSIPQVIMALLEVSHTLTWDLWDPGIVEFLVSHQSTLGSVGHLWLVTTQLVLWRSYFNGLLLQSHSGQKPSVQQCIVTHSQSMRSPDKSCWHLKSPILKMSVSVR